MQGFRKVFAVFSLCGTAPRCRLLPEGTAPRCRLLPSSGCGSLPCVARPPAVGCYLKARPPVTSRDGPPLSAVTEQRLRLSALCGTAPRWRLLPKGTAPRCRLLSSSDCGSLPCVVRPPAGGCYLKGRPPAVGCYRAATAALCLVWHGSPLSVVTSRHAPPLSAVTKQRLRFYPFPAVGCNGTAPRWRLFTESGRRPSAVAS